MVNVDALLGMVVGVLLMWSLFNLFARPKMKQFDEYDEGVRLAVDTKCPACRELLLLVVEKKRENGKGITSFTLKDCSRKAEQLSCPIHGQRMKMGNDGHFVCQACEDEAEDLPNDYYKPQEV